MTPKPNYDTKAKSWYQSRPKIPEPTYDSRLWYNRRTHDTRIVCVWTVVYFHMISRTSRAEWPLAYPSCADDLPVIPRCRTNKIPTNLPHLAFLISAFNSKKRFSRFKNIRKWCPLLFITRLTGETYHSRSFTSRKTGHLSHSISDFLDWKRCI